MGISFVSHTAAIGNFTRDTADNLIELINNELRIIAIRIGYASNISDCIIFIGRDQSQIVRINDNILQVAVLGVGRI